jgi:HPt (histidine-containing phosphotransfer) domain-containing protein
MIESKDSSNNIGGDEESYVGASGVERKSASSLFDRSLWEQYPDLVEQFLLTLPAKISEFNSAMMTHDMSTVAKLAHRLKGSLSMYGLPKMAELVAVLEAHVANSAPHVLIKEIVSELLELSDEIIQEYNKMREAVEVALGHSSETREPPSKE